MKRKERSANSPGAATESKKKKKYKTEKSCEVSPSKLDFDTPEKVLGSLLSPTHLNTFFSEYWEKKPLVIKRNDAEYYGDLFLKEHLEDILKKHKLQYEDDINVCRYVEGQKELLNKEGRATFAKIQNDFKSSGATLQFHQPQRFMDDLWKLNEALERFFGCLVGANVYITPSKSQGLAPHYDDVEVFVLQLEGKKHWKLYKPLVELPQDYSPDLERECIGEPTHDFDLEQGDLLYFPRGTVHEAEAVGDGQHSTHVTISTYQHNSWGDLLMSVSEDIMEKAMDIDVEFRKGLPINCRSYIGYQYMHEDPTHHDERSAADGVKTEHKTKKTRETEQQDFRSHLGVLMGRLANHFDPHKAVDGLASDFMNSRLPPFVVNGETSKKGKDEESPPTDENSIRLLHPDHVRVLLVHEEPATVDENSEDEEEQSDEMSQEEEKGSDEVEEDEKGSNKKRRSRGEKQPAAEKRDEIEEEEEEEEDEKPANKKMKTQGRKQEREGKKEAVKKKDEEQKEEREEKPAEKQKPRGKQEQPTENKADSEEEAEEAEKDEEDKEGEGEGGAEEEEEMEQENGDDVVEEDEEEDEEEEEEEGEGEEDEKEWIVVVHSLNNHRTRHMIGEHEPSAIKFPLMCQDALRYILSRPEEYIPVSALPLPEEERVALVTSLWAERLIEKV